MGKKILLVAFLFSAAVHAQNWSQEPESVLGVYLGRPISESPIQRCGAEQNPQSPCLRDGRQGSLGRVAYPIAGHPFDYSTATAYVDQTGVVATVEFHMSHDSFAKFLEVLRSRYGNETSSNSEPAQTKGGQVFTNLLSQWNGKRISIIAMERVYTVDRSAVVFSDNQAAIRSNEARKERAKTMGNSL